MLETLDMGQPIASSTTFDHPGSANTVQWFREGDRQDLTTRWPPENRATSASDHPRAAGVVAAVVRGNFDC